ncbi:hypothetical protein K458DRAFT_379389 [Lentithecium fluviatile CBS 122367]|uniref:C2H2-type domain-containing protein n=1 Tax=Lentithecium fluviatile CBS 122367 TaxID=1168545 RepID=A0A6G1IFX3_9PLEO|nr:hypothetical protein K458DRAFT_379389 [Lentithecium fluviatile CBS 122367]
MRSRSSADESSDESEYVGSDLDDSAESDTDLTSVNICTADEDGDEQPCDSTDDEAISPSEDHPPEYYHQQLETFDEQEYTKQDYKDSSTRLLDRIEEQWNCCWKYLRKERFRDYATVSVGTLHTFFDWLLSQRRGKGGRIRRGTKLASSLGTYWKVFRLVYERATTVKLDGKLNRSMHKVLRKLAREHGLKKVGRDKACMYVEDLNQVLQTNLATSEKRYPHGRYRIQAQLYLQLGGFTANRPQALLSLCYQHIQVTLLRDPEGGPHRVLLEFTFEFTKEFLGIKDMNTFPLPEVIFDETLVFSPHVFLLGILFHDGAFAAYNLTSPNELSKLHIAPGRNELRLHLNQKLRNVPVFRKAVKTLNGWTISDTAPLPYSTLLPWIRSLGQITGFAEVTRPYSLRYGGGKAFNENGNVSEAMQNLMMGHASIGTFLKHYLSRRVTVDTQAVVRGLQPQDALMRAACTMSRSIDRRRPRRLTPEQSASVNEHPKVISLLERREKLKRTHGTKHLKYQELNRKINQERQRQRHALLQSVKERWEYEQPVRDVEQQLDGVEVKNDVDVIALLPVQKELVDATLARPGLSIIEEMCRRNEAICAVMRYCGIEEGGGNLSRTKRSSSHITLTSKSEDLAQPNPDNEALEDAKVSVYKDERPTICFLCLGNDKLPTQSRTYSFHTSGDLSKHFKRKHLQHIKEGDQLRCNLCRVDLEDEMHLRRHAHDVHGTVS